MSQGTDTDLCADLLELVRHQRPDILWLALQCETEDGESWLRAYVAQGERDYRFVLLVPDAQGMGLSVMAAQLIAEAERWVSGHGRH